MTNYVNLFSDELTNRLIYESGFKQSKCQMYTYYRYAPDGSKLGMLSYVYIFVYWYTYENLGKWFMDTLGKRLHVEFTGYEYWFIYIRISQLKDHSI